MAIKSQIIRAGLTDTLAVFTASNEYQTPCPMYSFKIAAVCFACGLLGLGTKGLASLLHSPHQFAADGGLVQVGNYGLP